MNNLAGGSRNYASWKKHSDDPGSISHTWVGISLLLCKYVTRLISRLYNKYLPVELYWLSKRNAFLTIPMIRGKKKSCFFFKKKLIDLKKKSYLFFDLKKYTILIGLEEQKLLFTTTKTMLFMKVFIGEIDLSSFNHGQLLVDYWISTTLNYHFMKLIYMHWKYGY